MDLVERYADWSYALAVAGAAYIWPPLALLVAGAYLATFAYLVDRRTHHPEETTE